MLELEEPTVTAKVCNFLPIHAQLSPSLLHYFLSSPFSSSSYISSFWWFHCISIQCSLCFCLFNYHAIYSTLSSLSFPFFLCLPIFVFLSLSHSFSPYLCLCPCPDGRFPSTGRCLWYPSVYHHSARHRPTSTLSIWYEVWCTQIIVQVHLYIILYLYYHLLSSPTNCMKYVRSWYVHTII